MLTLVAWGLLAAGIGLDSGQFHPVALLLVLAAEGVLVRLVARGGEPSVGRLLHLAAPAGVVLLAVVAWRPVWYASGPALRLSHALAAVAVAVALWATASAAAPSGPSGRRLPWALPPAVHWVLPAALAAAATVAMVRAAPTPSIDVWVFGQQAAEAMTDGRNVYTQTWVGSPGLTDAYPYLPWTVVLLVPAHVLLGDVRYGLLAAVLLASWAARRVALRRLTLRPGSRPATAAAAVLVPLLLLLIPRWTWSVAQAWTEPLLLAGVALAVWASAHGRRLLSVVLLGVTLAVKQHVTLLLPLLVRWLGPRRALGAAALGGLLVLPWFVAATGAFWHDAVVANLALEPRLRSLGLASLARRLGLPWSSILTLVAVLAAGTLAWRRLPRDAYGFLLGGALVLLTLDLTNTQSFFNHYTFPLGLLALAALTAPLHPNHEQGLQVSVVTATEDDPGPAEHALPMER